VAFPIYLETWDTQAHFLKTIALNDRLAQHVVKLSLGRNHHVSKGDAVIERSIGEAMKKLVNLKKLNLYAQSSNYIVSAHLDSVPFSLTRLVLSWRKPNPTDPDPPLLSILQAHPTLEELFLSHPSGCLPPDLISALIAEQDGLSGSEKGILCPEPKRFRVCDEDLRLFLPNRRIECVASWGCGAERILETDQHVSTWLNPILIPSYHHIRILEVWANPDQGYIWFLPTIAPYLTSLTHLCIFDDIRKLGQDDYDLTSTLGQVQTLQSLTMSSVDEDDITMADVQEAVQFVRGVLPDIQEIIVGLDEEGMVYYRYVKEEGMQRTFVDHGMAFGPYNRWVHDL